MKIRVSADTRQAEGAVKRLKGMFGAAARGIGAFTKAMGVVGFAVHGLQAIVGAFKTLHEWVTKGGEAAKQMRRELEQLRLSIAQSASQQKPDFGNELLPELDWDDEGDSSEDDSEMDWEKEGDLFAEGIAAEIDWEEEPLDDMSEDELAWMDDDVETTDEELESEDGNTEEEDYEDFDLAAFVDLSVRNLQALSFVERMRREGKQTSEISLSELMEYLDKKKEEAKEIA